MGFDKLQLKGVQDFYNEMVRVMDKAFTKSDYMTPSMQEPGGFVCMMDSLRGDDFVIMLCHPFKNKSTKTKKEFSSGDFFIVNVLPTNPHVVFLLPPFEGRKQPPKIFFPTPTHHHLLNIAMCWSVTGTLTIIALL